MPRSGPERVSRVYLRDNIRLWVDGCVVLLFLLLAFDSVITMDALGNRLITLAYWALLAAGGPAYVAWLLLERRYFEVVKWGLAFLAAFVVLMYYYKRCT
jgi:hypothetical protein